MKICVKLAKFAGMVLGAIAAVLVLFGVIGYIVWFFNEAPFLNVANYWNYLYASIPFTLLAICCAVFVIAADKKG
jgi:hypothetical protein